MSCYIDEYSLERYLIVLMQSFPTPADPLSQSQIDAILDMPNIARSKAARGLVGPSPSLLEKDFIKAMDHPRALYERIRYQGADHVMAFAWLGSLGTPIVGGTGMRPESFTYPARTVSP